MMREVLAQRLKNWEQMVLAVRKHTVEDVDACALLHDAYQIIKEAFDCPMEYTMHSLSKGIVCPKKPCLTRAALAKQLAAWRMQVLDSYDSRVQGDQGRIDHAQVFTDVYRLQVTAANILEVVFGIRAVDDDHRVEAVNAVHKTALKSIWFQLIKLQTEIDGYTAPKNDTCSSADCEIFDDYVYEMLRNASEALDCAIQCLEDGINHDNDSTRDC